MNKEVVLQKPRRTQAERTATTRAALIDATIRVLHENGYGAATSERIADVSGVSRASIIHHYGSRTQLLAEVVRTVFDRELQEVLEIEHATGLGNNVEDWPELLWDLYSRPSGLAVLEILIAARSDAELSALVGATLRENEHGHLDRLMTKFGGSSDQTISAFRLLVWSVRGLSAATMLVDDPEGVKQSVALFKTIISSAVEQGILKPDDPHPSQQISPGENDSD